MKNYELLKENIAKSKPKHIRTTRSVLTYASKIDPTTRVVQPRLHGIVQIDKNQSNKSYYFTIYELTKSYMLVSSQIHIDFQEKYNKLWEKAYIFNQKWILQFTNQDSAEIITEKIRKIIKKKMPFFGCCIGRPPRQANEQNLKPFLWKQKKIAIVPSSLVSNQSSNIYMKQIIEQSSQNPQNLSTKMDMDKPKKIKNILKTQESQKKSITAESGQFNQQQIMKRSNNRLMQNVKSVDKYLINQQKKHHENTNLSFVDPKMEEFRNLVVKQKRQYTFVVVSPKGEKQKQILIEDKLSNSQRNDEH